MLMSLSLGQSLMVISRTVVRQLGPIVSVSSSSHFVSRNVCVSCSELEEKTICFSFGRSTHHRFPSLPLFISNDAALKESLPRVNSSSRRQSAISTFCYPSHATATPTVTLHRLPIDSFFSRGRL